MGASMMGQTHLPYSLELHEGGDFTTFYLGHPQNPQHMTTRTLPIRDDSLVETSQDEHSLPFHRIHIKPDISGRYLFASGMGEIIPKKKRLLSIFQIRGSAKQVIKANK